MSTTARRRAVLVLLAALLLPPAALHAGDRTPAVRPAALWSPLAALWQIVTATACDKGILIDPDGRCATAAAPAATQAACDKGSSIDPDGRCAQ
jgi:hypothetical protein